MVEHATAVQISLRVVLETYAAFARGAQYYDRNGARLSTPLGVLEEMRWKRVITVQTGTTRAHACTCEAIPGHLRSVRDVRALAKELCHAHGDAAEPKVNRRG